MTSNAGLTRMGPNSPRNNPSLAGNLDALINIVDGPPHYNWMNTNFAGGAKGDNTADDAAAIQASIDAFGSTASMHGGRSRGTNGAFKIGTTLNWDRKSGILEGNGPGTTLGPDGTTLVWGGGPGIPMILVRRSWGFVLRDFRILGANNPNKPSAGIEINFLTGDSPAPTGMRLENLWLGQFGSFDTNLTLPLQNGIITSGDNAQCDQSSMNNIHIDGIADSAIILANTQNVAWLLTNIFLNAAATGVVCSARYIVGMNWVFTGIRASDINLQSDSSLRVIGYASEQGVRLVNGTGAIVMQDGYWQAGPNIALDGNVVDITVTGGTKVWFEDFDITRAGGYAGPQEKVKVRAKFPYVHLKNFGAFGKPDTVLDIATNAAGGAGTLVLENYVDASAAVNNHYNGVYRWNHGSPVPSFNTGAIYQPGGVGRLSGQGVPSNTIGLDGDFYDNGAGTVAANTVQYHKEAGVWVPLVTT